MLALVLAKRWCWYGEKWLWNSWGPAVLVYFFPLTNVFFRYTRYFWPIAKCGDSHAKTSMLQHVTTTLRRFDKYRDGLVVKVPQDRMAIKIHHIAQENFKGEPQSFFMLFPLTNLCLFFFLVQVPPEKGFNPPKPPQLTPSEGRCRRTLRVKDFG